MKSWKTSLLLLSTALGLQACGGSSIETGAIPQPHPSATVQLGAFNLGSDFPADLQIPSGPGLGNTAFVLTVTPPSIIPLNLDSNPIEVSQTFPILDTGNLQALGTPNNLLILNAQQGFVLGSSGVSYFNPSTGQILETQSLVEPLAINTPLVGSGSCDYDGDGTEETQLEVDSFAPNFPADLAFLGGKLFVTVSNGCFSGFESFYLPGLLLAFDVNDSAPYLTPATTPFTLLPGFNATAITVHQDRLWITSTGDTTLLDGASLPETDSFLTELDPENLEILQSLNLGLVAANFQPMAVTQEGDRGFLGSSAFSEVYEIDLEDFSVVRGANNPIQIFDVATDFLSDQEISEDGQTLMVSSFNQSAVKRVDLREEEAIVLPEVLDFAFTGQPGVTGAGPMALRPGTPGEDFTGPDLWLLTSNPGTVSNATTY